MQNVHMGSLHWPRLLPLTIAVMGVMLVWRSTTLVLAATSPGASDAAANAVAPNAGAKAAGGESSKLAGKEKSAIAESPVKLADAPVEGGEAGAPMTSGERQLLLDLKARRDALEARAKELEAREAIVNAAQGRIDERVKQLGALQTRLEALENARHAHDQENWGELVKVYEQMKPRDAAQIFDALDMPVLLGLMDRMQSKKLAGVLAAMNPDRARLATQMLAAARNRAVTPAAAAMPAAGAGGIGDANGMAGKNTGS